MVMDQTNAREAIRVEQLECRYGEKIILREITFAVCRNEIFFIAGRSGCGKSTLLRHLVGLQEPFRGRILYFGKELTSAEPSDRREFFKSFGVLFQEDALWTDMTLSENVGLPLALHTKLSRQTRDEIARFKLAQVGLAGYQDYLPSELSGGMQKRAALARALALDPAILFFDEPTAGLDPITMREIDQLILRVRQTIGATIVVVSHSVPSIMGIADRLLLLDAETKGIVATGSPEELSQNQTKPLVREFFSSESAPLTK